MANLEFNQVVAIAALLSFMTLVVIVYVIDFLQTMQHLKSLAPKKSHHELRREQLRRIK